MTGTFSITKRDAMKRLTVREQVSHGSLARVLALAAASFMAASAAQAQQTPVQVAAADAGLSGNSPEEIVVTAPLIEQRVRTEPIAATVLSGRTLNDFNMNRLADYFASVPGLNVTASQPAFQNISIRGITTGDYSNPRVGILIDGAPFGPTLEIGGGKTLPDLDPNNFVAIEVLKGPQGADHGPNTIGGLINYVTPTPSFDAYSGHVTTGFAAVENGSEPGYNLRGAVNIPINEKIALIANGFVREDPGYISNPVRHLDGINKRLVFGGGLVALWRPSDDFSLKINTFFQNYHLFASDDSDTRIGPLEQNYIPGTSGYHTDSRVVTATAKYSMGDVTVQSITGFNNTKFYGTPFDDTSFFGAIGAQAFNGNTAVSEMHTNSNDKYTEDLRVTIPLPYNFEWLLGGFYDHEHTGYASNYYSSNADTGNFEGIILAQTFPTTYQEGAIFSDLTLHVTDSLDIQAGLRESWIDQHEVYTMSGPYVGIAYGLPSPQTADLTNSVTSFTYMGTVRYKVTQDLMTYARIATGFAPGGFNAFVAPSVPDAFTPEKTTNYEVGVKGDVDHLFTIDLALYYTNWKGIQIGLTDPSNGQGFTGNAGLGKSEGVELALDAHPWQGISINLAMSYDDAELSESLPANSPLVGKAGNRLPDVAPFTMRLAIDQDFPLWGDATGRAGGAFTYVGDRVGPFQYGSPIRSVHPSYETLDLHLGFMSDGWSANLFVNNVTDERGILAGGPGYLFPFANVYITPRTVGLNVTRSF